ncbi:MAG: FCD domain-containing protein [Streptosporangiales bacterium]|nr:FCD domain-containing protein [Streptosporangiales bacterium]
MTGLPVRHCQELIRLSSELPRSVGARYVQRPVPLREGVYEAILEMIVTRALGPGRHLVEGELAELLGVSRQPVREALQRLSMEGWVDLRPALGAFVHVPTDAEADQLLVVRAMIESESARLAAAYVAEAGDDAKEDVERLRGLWRHGVETLRRGDVDVIVSANAEFHAAVNELTGNEVLAGFAAQVDRRVQWYYNPVARQRGSASWDEHAELIDAIAAGDGDRAAQIMRAHTEHTRRSYHDRPPEEAPAEPEESPRRTRRKR